MAGPIKLDIEKPSQEFDIGGNIYEVYYDDDSLKNHMEKLQETHEYLQSIKDKQPDQMSKEEQEKYVEEQKQKMTEFFDSFFGEGSFEQIYEDCNRSMINVHKVMEQVAGWLKDKFEPLRKAQVSYYTGASSKPKQKQ